MSWFEYTHNPKALGVPWPQTKIRPAFSRRSIAARSPTCGARFPEVARKPSSRTGERNEAFHLSALPLRGKPNCYDFYRRGSAGSNLSIRPGCVFRPFDSLHRDPALAPSQCRAFPIKRPARDGDSCSGPTAAPTASWHIFVSAIDSSDSATTMIIPLTIFRRPHRRPPRCRQPYLNHKLQARLEGRCAPSAGRRCASRWRLWIDWTFCHS